MKEEGRLEVSVGLRVVQFIGVGSWLFAYVLAFTAGYGAGRLFGVDSPSWIQKFAEIGLWVSASIALVAMLVWRVATRPEEILANIGLKEAGWSEPQSSPPQLWLAGRVFGPMGLIHGAGLLLRPDIDFGDAFSAWGTIIVGSAGVVVAEIWRIRGRRRHRELELLAKEGTIMVGKLSRVRWRSGEGVVDSARVTVTFTDSVGAPHTAKGEVDGEPDSTTRFDVLYLPGRPEIRPIIRRTYTYKDLAGRLKF